MGEGCRECVGHSWDVPPLKVLPGGACSPTTLKAGCVGTELLFRGWGQSGKPETSADGRGKRLRTAGLPSEVCSSLVGTSVCPAKGHCSPPRHWLLSIAVAGYRQQQQLTGDVCLDSGTGVRVGGGGGGWDRGDTLCLGHPSL